MHGQAIANHYIYVRNIGIQVNNLPCYLNLLVGSPTLASSLKITQKPLLYFLNITMLHAVKSQTVIHIIFDTKLL